MKLEQPQFSAPPIESYGPGGFRVAGQWREGALFLHGETIEAWPDPDISNLELSAFSTLLAGEIPPDILVLGVGNAMIHVPLGLNKALLAQRIGLEAAATPAACRTYNVLLGQGRDIAAALIPVTAE